jgi:dCMP deaminase
VDSCHAEANALLFAGRHGASTLDTTMYCTHAPCLACSGLLLNAGVARVVYRMSYRSDEGLERLAAAGVKVQKHG